MRYYVRCLLVTAFVLMLALLLYDPGSHAVVNFVGEALPLTLLLSLLLGSPTKPAGKKRISDSERAIAETEKLKAERDAAYLAGRREERERQELARKRAELEADTPSWSELAQHNALTAAIRARVQAGTMTAAQAREAWAQLSPQGYGLLDPKTVYQPHLCGGKFYANYTFCPEHGTSSPAAQLEKLSQQYGLPVVTELKKPGLPAVTSTHVCYHKDGVPQYRYTQDCPLHGASFAASLGKPVVILPPEPVAEEVPEPEPEPVDDYVPAGQQDMLAELHRVVKVQAREHGPAGHYPSLRWFMSPGWLAEVRKLRDTHGQLLCVPRPGQSVERLYGYPVTVGESFGVPELREP